MGFFVQLGILAGIYATKWVISKYTKKPQAEIPPRKDLDWPRVDQGQALPLFYGQVRIKSPILLWTSRVSLPGTAQARANMLWCLGTTGSVRNLVGGPTQTRSVQLRSMYVEDQRILITTPLVHAGVKLLYGSLFNVDGAEDVYYGANDGSDGDSGASIVQFFDGYSEQRLDNGLSPSGNNDEYAIYKSMLARGVPAAEIPGYRGQALVALTGDWLGTFEWPMGSNVHSFTFEVRSQSYSADFPQIPNGPANPAYVIFDLLTSSYGLRLPTSAVDRTSFVAAAATLYTEQHGFARVWYDPVPAADMIQEVVAQIDAALYFDPVDSKIKLKLIRDDLGAVGSLPLFDETNTAEILSYKVSTWEDTYQQVKLQYTQPYYADGAYAAAEVSKTAPGVASNGARTLTVHYPGLCDPRVAAEVAARELTDVSRPLVAVSLLVNRDAFNIYPGNGVRFSSALYEITDMVMRVTEIDYGSLDDDRIRIDLVQDAFNLGAVNADAAPEVEEAEYPLPIVEAVATEAPRWIQKKVQTLGGAIDVDSQYSQLLAVRRAPNDAYSAQSSYSTTTAVDQELSPDLRPTTFPAFAEVETEYPRTLAPYDTGTGLRITGLSDDWPAADRTANADQISIFGRHLMVVGTEYMSFESMTDLGGGVRRLNNVWRGVLDTVPQTHPVGTRAYLIDMVTMSHAFVGMRGFGIQDADSDITVKLWPAAQVGFVKDEAAEDAVLEYPLTFRTMRPYPAADFESPNITDGGALEEGGIDLTWKNRNRLVGQVTRGDAATQTGETGHEYEAVATNVRTGVAYPILFGGTAIAGSAVSVDQVNIAAAGTDLIDVSLKSVVEDTTPTGIWRKTSWQDPTIRVDAEPWRNLLTNWNLSYTPNAQPISHGWVIEDGSPVRADLDAETFVFLDSGSGDGFCQFSQTVNLWGWDPARMRAVAEWYDAMFTADADDTIQVKIDALDGDDAVVGTVTYGPSVPAASLALNHRSLNYASLPNTTRKVKVTVNFARVGGAGQCKVLMYAPSLRVGQFGDNLLTNGSFETDLASWTATTGTLDVLTAAPADGAKYVGEDTEATEYYQEIAIPTGYAFGIAVVEGMLRIASSGSATLTLEGRAGAGGSIVASDSAAVTGTSSFWRLKRASIGLSSTITHLRVKIAGTATGIHLFDDIRLAVHKEINPPWEVSYTWDSPLQPLPTSRDTFHLAYPEMSVPFAIWDGTSDEPTNRVGIGMGWGGDSLANPSQSRASAFHGAFGETIDDCRLDCFEFERDTGTDLRNAGTPDFMNFASTDDFTIALWVRWSEFEVGTACGLIGRCDPATYGWFVGIDTAGKPFVTLQGVAGNKTTTGVHPINDGQPHLLVIRHNATADTLKLSMRDVYGAMNHASTSTASGLGEFVQPSGIPFRIGNSHEDGERFPGQIARVYAWRDEAITDAEIVSLDTFGADPNGFAWTGTADAALLNKPCPTCFDLPPDVSGDLFSYYSPRGLAPWHYTDVPGGISAWGVRTGALAAVNPVASWDAESASWTSIGAPTLTNRVRAPSGIPRAVTITGTNAVARRIAANLTGATTRLVVSFRAKSTASHAITVARVDTANNVEDSATVTIGTAWNTYSVTIALVGDAYAATDGIAFYPSTDGTSRNVTIDPASVVVGSGYGAPTVASPKILQVAPLGSGRSATLVVAGMPASFTHEGEIDIVCHTPYLEDFRDGTVVLAYNGVNAKNRRDVRIDAVNDFIEFDHYDGAGTGVTSEVGTDALESGVRIRARWNNLGTLDDATTPFAGLRTYSETGTFQFEDYDRVASWAQAATEIPAERVRLGDFAGTIVSVTLRSREEKIQGD